MLTIYPSNRLEDLALLLNAVLQHRQTNVLAADTIIVENKGMQHWLNLQLASMQTISMNIKFKMPSSFIWELSQSILGVDKNQHGFGYNSSAYKSEIMTWCLDEILSSEEFMNHPDGQYAVNYWDGQTDPVDELKRFQLASALAKLFEQYLLYRPHWLDAWSKSQTATLKTSPEVEQTQSWQSFLWRLLLAKLAPQKNPSELYQQSRQEIKHKTHKLPKQIFLFAINSLPPQTLDFFKLLSEHTQVHLFHLNPCVEFWGEIKTDKTTARQIREQQLETWLQNDEVSNPLLANLGQQGKEFFNLLQSQQSVEIPAFTYAQADNYDFVDNTKNIPEQSVLTLMQNDILQLIDGREMPIDKQDASISINSCHSVLREIQVLHDYLLAQFNTKPELLPQDILVMCPAIENYAPYINAVFRHQWDGKFDAENPRLACSISDLTFKDSQPLINHFLDLMELPDSRFEVSKIVDYIRLPELQKKFGFSDSDIEIIQWWLKDASIHWAIDSEHKAKIAHLEQASDMYTWQWGLERLLLGFAFGDSEQVVNKRLLIANVEGKSALILGRLMQLLERLQVHIKHLTIKRTALQWQQFLNDTLEQFYELTTEDTKAKILIKQVIDDFSDNTSMADYQHKISYCVMRHYLQQSFSQSGNSQQFMSGQITFCSMIPMRSIPFKIIAILGLNDGDFPRQNIPMNFDLMTQQNRMPGDRSKRSDDRYLFLEALISAREKLYLSYQGRDNKKNTPRQASLVLKELMEYLEKAYQWNFSDEVSNSSNSSHSNQSSHLNQHPLHAFSPSNYQGETSSFDPHWLRLAVSGTIDNSYENNYGNNYDITIENDLADDQIISIEEIIQFYSHPLKYFAQQKLGLYLNQQQLVLQDIEPFDADNLIAYTIRKDLCDDLLKGDDSHPEQVIQANLLSGQLADSPITLTQLDNWHNEAEKIVGQLNQYGQITYQLVQINIAGIELQASIPWLDDGQGLLYWRPSSIKAKDELMLWLFHLIAIVSKTNSYSKKEAENFQSIGLFFDAKTQKVKKFSIQHLSLEQAQLNLELLIDYFKKGLCQPSLLYADLGKALIKTQHNKEYQQLQQNMAIQNKSWQGKLSGNYNQIGLMDDEYFHWFYPTLPPLTDKLHSDFYAIYQPLYLHLQEIKK